jgi:hypothetical protein
VAAISTSTPLASVVGVSRNLTKLASLTDQVNSSDESSDGKVEAKLPSGIKLKQMSGRNFNKKSLSFSSVPEKGEKQVYVEKVINGMTIR